MSDFAMCTRCDVATETSYNREGEKVCSQCGLIVESSLIVTEVQFAQDGSCTSTMVVSNNKSTGSKKSRADGNMDRVLNRCKATQYSEQCFTVLHELQNKGTASRDTYLLAASVVLFVLKSNSKPYSITDIAKQAEVNIFDLGKVYKRVEDILKVQPDEVHHSQFVNRAIGSLQGLEERAVSFIRTQADQLIAITKDHCFSTGRHPIAIIAGAVFVSLETYYAKKQTPLNHNYISNIAKSLVVAERTIKARSSEIKKLLIAKYNAIKDNLGIHIKVSKKNLNEVIPDLLMMIHGSSLNSNTTTDLQVSTSPTRPTDPPAFLHNQKLRERRSLKLDRAKQRLCSTLMGGQQNGEQLTEPDSTKQQKKRTFQEYDDEDRLIEMNLLQGVPDDAILTGYYNTDPNIGTPTVSSGDEELGEGDLPEEELYQFVRPDSEVDPENSLYDHSDVNQDKPSIHESPYKRRCFDLRN